MYKTLCTYGNYSIQQRVWLVKDILLIATPFTIVFDSPLEMGYNIRSDVIGSGSW